MYYPDELVEEVRARNPIVDVIGNYVQLKRSGANYFGLCPFHNEKSGSFSVSPSKQMYYCFGCHAGGNVITFIMNYENYSFQEALEVLAKRAGITLPEQTYSREQRQEQDKRALLLKMHKDAAVFYAKKLRTEEGRKAYQYLKGRQLSDSVILSFGLGVSGTRPDSLYRHLKELGYRDEDMKDSGLISFNERGSYDRFWNRVMFPIMDAQSRVVGFGGRVMGDGKPKYLNSPETKIFDKSRNLYGLFAARKTREKYFLVCEGYMDVIALHQAGFTNAVASLGTAFTSQHGMIIRRYVHEVVLCYDNDGAGKNAALRAIPILRDAGLNVRVLSMAPFKDPDEFMKNLGADEFRVRIGQAVNAFIFELRALREGYDFADPQAKSDFFNECAKRLSAFPDEIERNSYTEAVANEFGIDYGTLRRKVNENGNASSYSAPREEPLRTPAQASGRPKRDSGVREAEKLVLTALSDEPELFAAVREILSPSDFSDELLREVASMLYRQLEKGSAVPAEIISHFIDEEQASLVTGLFSSDYTASFTEEERDTAIREAILRIRKDSIERRMSEVSDSAELMKLMKEKQEADRLDIRLRGAARG